MKDFLTVEYWEQFGIADRDKTREYLNLVTNAKTIEGYKELHHIVPKSFDDTLKDDPNNLVWLSGKDHFQAHKLLSQCFEGLYKQKMVYAFHMMCYNKTNNHYDITQEDYELARQQMSEDFKLNNPAKREDVKKKIAKGGLKRTGKNNGNYGGISEANRKHLSESRIASGVAKGEKNPMYGKHHTEESKRKMSEHSKGKNPKLSETCKNLIWITNGKEDKRIYKDSEIPEGYRRGRTKGIFGNYNSTTIEHT